MQKPKLIVVKFFWPVLAWNLLVTLGCIPYLYAYNFAVLPLTIFFKLVGYFLTIGIVYLYQQNTFYFFRNAGYNLFKLFAGMLALDLMLYLVITAFYFIAKAWLKF